MNDGYRLDAGSRLSARVEEQARPARGEEQARPPRGEEQAGPARSADRAGPARDEEQGRQIAPFEARTVALFAAGLIAVPFALYAGAAFFIPLFLSVFTSFALSPVVDWMERCRVPRAAGAAMVMLLVIAGASAGIQQALSGAAEVLDELPQAVQRLRVVVSTWQRDGTSPLSQVRKTADELQKLAGATTTARAESDTVRAAGGSPRARNQDIGRGRYRRHGTWSSGQLVSVLFLTYFLLAAGDLFRRRLMQAIGPSLTTRKKAVQILNRIHQVSRRYFALVLVMNIVGGNVTCAGLYFLRCSTRGFLGHRHGHPAHHPLSSARPR